MCSTLYVSLLSWAVQDLIQVQRQEHGGDSVAGTISVFVKHIDRHLETHTFAFPTTGHYKLENDGPAGKPSHSAMHGADHILLNAALRLNTPWQQDRCSGQCLNNL